MGKVDLQKACACPYRLRTRQTMAASGIQEAASLHCMSTGDLTHELRRNAALTASHLCRLPPKTVLKKKDASLAPALTAGMLKPLIGTFQQGNCQPRTALLVQVIFSHCMQDKKLCVGLAFKPRPGQLLAGTHSTSKLLRQGFSVSYSMSVLCNTAKA